MAILQNMWYTLRVQFPEFKFEDFVNEVAKSLLTLIWKVVISLRREIQFESKKKKKKSSLNPSQLSLPQA